MTAIMDAANAAVRDYVTDGVPASGDHDPIKSEVRGVFAVIDAALASLGVNGAITVKKATKALLDADLAHIADTLAIVYNDSDPALNGIYAKSGGSGSGSWAITALAIPSSFAAEIAEENIKVALALGYNVTRAFATLADRTAATPVTGETAVIYADPTPGNNLKSQYNGSSWPDGLPIAQARYVYERGTVTAGANTTPCVIDMNAVWNSGANNDGDMWGIRLDIDTQSLTNFNPGSRFIDLRANNVSRFEVTGEGYLTLRDAAGTSVGGMRLRGSGGETDLTSQLDAGSGQPAPVMTYYWESTTGEAAVLRGRGTNRFSIESDASMVHISDVGRYEWEGLVSDRLQFIGYEAGSAIGKTFDFNNSGQTPTRASPVVSMSVTNTADNMLNLCTLSGSTYTDVFQFRGTGHMFMKNVSAAPATPTGGGVVYVESGALKYKGTSGTVTTLGPA